jgi:hypothetical protein
VVGDAEVELSLRVTRFRRVGAIHCSLLCA